MKIKNQKCRYCKRQFIPDRRVGKRQKRCFREACRLAENRRKVRKWMHQNPDVALSLRTKTRLWAKAYPNYWKQYRKSHPRYVKRDNRRRVKALRKARRSAKLTSMRTTAVEKLQHIESLNSANCSAKLTEKDRRVDGIMDYLLWRVNRTLSAKQTYTDLRLGP